MIYSLLHQSETVLLQCLYYVSYFYMIFVLQTIMEKGFLYMIHLESIQMIQLKK
jgi:hypothetical protein